jgi:hypothetical protein
MALLEQYGQELADLLVYGMGIALYTLAIAVLYVPLGTRMMFARRFGDQHVATAGRRFLYVLAFPLLSFLFFLLIAATMFFMANFSGDELTDREVMTISMAVVLAIRTSAYFSETAAADLAKVMPLSLLAVVLVTNGLGDLRESVERLGAFGEERHLLGLYLLLVIVFEFVLRGVYEAVGRPTRQRKRPPGQPVTRGRPVQPRQDRSREP